MRRRARRAGETPAPPRSHHMNILFVHNSFPAQFKNVVQALTALPGMRVAAIGSRGAMEMDRVRLQRYEVTPVTSGETHPFARRFDVECRRAEQILYASTALLRQGFAPHVVFAHCGWGESLPLREAFPRSRVITYCEFYYRSHGLDVNFDPEFGNLSLDAAVNLQLKNAATLLSLVESDDGVAPTLWQKVDLSDRAARQDLGAARRHRHSARCDPIPARC